MAYTKQTWNTGDIITAEKLNHIEDGLEELLGGDGYEINAPTLKLNVTNGYEEEIPFGAGFVLDDDRYIKFETFIAPVGESVMNAIVLGVEVDGDVEYYFELQNYMPSVVDHINCTYDDETGFVTITDPTQDAEIVLEYSGLS